MRIFYDILQENLTQNWWTARDEGVESIALQRFKDELIYCIEQSDCWGSLGPPMCCAASWSGRMSFRCLKHGAATTDCLSGEQPLSQLWTGRAPTAQEGTEKSGFGQCQAKLCQCGTWPRKKTRNWADEQLMNSRRVNWYIELPNWSPWEAQALLQSKGLHCDECDKAGTARVWKNNECNIISYNFKLFYRNLSLLIYSHQLKWWVPIARLPGTACPESVGHLGWGGAGGDFDQVVAIGCHRFPFVAGNCTGWQSPFDQGRGDIFRFPSPVFVNSFWKMMHRTFSWKIWRRPTKGLLWIMLFCLSRV